MQYYYEINGNYCKIYVCYNYESKSKLLQNIYVKSLEKVNENYCKSVHVKSLGRDKKLL
jgi:hypothetical protein